MKKRLISMTLAIVMLTGVAVGCGQNEPASDSSAAVSSISAEKSTAVETSTAMSKEPITFTVFSKDINTNYENWESPVAKKITELTGVTLKMEYPVGELSQKVGLMIASNEYPDMIFTSGKEQNQLISAGAYRKLDELIEKHGKNLKNLYGDYIKRLRYTPEDPSIYYLGSWGVGAQRWKPNMGFEFQHAVVKELGYPKLKTLQDAENVIKAYKEKHPTIDGKPTIGLTFIAEDWRWQCAPGNMSAFVTGKPDDGNWYIDPATYEATFRFYKDDAKLYYQWLNHMNDTGLLDPEAFVQKYDQYISKLSSGRVIAFNDQDWEFQDAQLSLRNDKKYDNMYGLYPVQANDSYTCGDFQDFGYAGGAGMAISSSCKDPDRAMQFLDWMASDEAQILNNWGIEGQHYVIENGKRVITKEMWNERLNNKNFAKETGVRVYAYPFPERGDGVKDPTGQYYTINTPEQLIENYTEVEKEVLKGYGAKMWKDLYPQADKLPKSAWGQAWQIPYDQNSDIALIIKKCEDIMKLGIPKAVLAKPDDFDKVWAGIMAELKAAGVEKANADFTKLVKDRIELWK